MHPAIEAFVVFFRLGLTSFGGPVAHLGNFRTELVERRRWIGDPEYADTVALCQFLPGPTSSQACFAVGLRRAGLAGGIAAWAGFTAPSATAMGLAGWWLTEGAGVAGQGWLAGLRAFAVAVVVHAIVGMSRTLAPTVPHLALAAAAMLLNVRAHDLGLPPWLAAGVQPLTLAAGAVAGARLFRRPPAATPPAADDSAVRAALFHLPRSLSALAMLAFVGLIGLTFLAEGAPRVVQATAVSVRTGALVFGGGHVVLPIIEQPFVQHGWLSRDAVLSGYALVQAMPGPLFTLASYLGAAMAAASGPLAAAGTAALLVTAICVPGLLLVVAALPAWHRLRGVPGMQASLAGVGCAVVGILAAALLSDVLPGGVANPAGAAIAVAAGALLFMGRVPVTLIAAGAAAAGHLAMG